MKLIGYEHRSMVVAIFEKEQRPEPPGRSGTRRVEHVLVESKASISATDIGKIISEVAEGPVHADG